MTISLVLNTISLSKIQEPMLDLFSEFKKAHLKQHLAIAGTAFAFALGVNYLLFTTDTGVKLQASAIEATGKNQASIGADIEITQ